MTTKITGNNLTIVTKYIGPTNTKPSRVKASTYGCSITITYDSEFGSIGAHDKAAKALMNKAGLLGVNWVRGYFSENGYVYVWKD